MIVVTATIKGYDKLQEFPNWRPVLNEWLSIGLSVSLGNLKRVAIRNSYERFQHPSGALEGRFLEPIYSRSLPVVSGAVTNDSPHAFRREYGFSGKTDSLGRYYKNDPGVLYMTDTLESETQWVKEKFEWAVKKALAELSTSGGV